MRGVHNFLLRNFVCVFSRGSKWNTCLARLFFARKKKEREKRKQKSKKKKKENTKRKKKKRRKRTTTTVAFYTYSWLCRFRSACSFFRRFLQPLPTIFPSLQTPSLYAFNVRPTNRNSPLSSAVFLKNTRSISYFAERGVFVLNKCNDNSLCVRACVSNKREQTS